MKIVKAIASYLIDCRAGLDSETVYIYDLALSRLKEYLTDAGVKKIKQIRPDHVRDFMARLRAGEFRDSGSGPISDNTTHQHYRSIATFFNWLIREGKLEESPMHNIRPPAQPQALTRYLAPADIGRLVKATRETKHPVRDLAIVALFLDTGLRREELARLKPDDIDLAEHTAAVRLGKGHKGRIVPLSSRCVEILDVWLAIRADHLPSLFGLGAKNIYQIFYRMRRRIPDLGDVSPHKLRHTFGTFYAGDIRDTSAILGHADIGITAAVYIHRQTLVLCKDHDAKTPLRLTVLKPLDN